VATKEVEGKKESRETKKMQERRVISNKEKTNIVRKGVSEERKKEGERGRRRNYEKWTEKK
jgi:hypothetical protein